MRTTPSSTSHGPRRRRGRWSSGGRRRTRPGRRMRPGFSGRRSCPRALGPTRAPTSSSASP
eukprot:16394821-Heterocapsa_arctica.AAC.1